LLVSGSSDAKYEALGCRDGQGVGKSVFLRTSRDWLVLTSDGLFDGSPSAWNQILWRFFCESFRRCSVELFFNDYYYPGLLAICMPGKGPWRLEYCSEGSKAAGPETVG
jgi:hypothetical protein